MRFKLGQKTYIAYNVVLAILFLNVLFFGNLLRAGPSFTAGLTTGIGIGWLIFAIAGWIELRRPGRTMDERAAAIFGKACAAAFWVVILATSLLQVLLRSEIFSLALDARGCAALIGNLGLASLGVSWFIAARKG